MKLNRVPYRRVRMNKEMIQILEEQKQRFRQKFGRDPRPEDPVIWDENATEPTPASLADIHQTIRSAMIAAGSRPEFVHAFDKTGRIVTETNMHLLTPEEYQEWVDAVEEFRQRN